MGEHLVIPVECRASASGPRLHGVLLSEGRAASGGRSELFVPGSIVWPAEGIGIGLQHLGAVETRAVPTRVGNEIRVEAEATPKLFAAVQAGARYMSLEFHPLFRVVGDPPAAGRLRSTGITPPQHYYTPLRHPLAFGSLPGVAGYRAYLAPAISHRGEEGFSSCSACPLSSCHRFHPAEVGRSSQAAFNRPCCLRPLVAGSALRNRLSRPLARSLALWPDDSQISPRETLSIGFRNSVSLLPAIQATGLLTITPAGLSPAEQTSLCWTHHQLS